MWSWWMTYKTSAVSGEPASSTFSVQLDGKTEILSFWKKDIQWCPKLELEGVTSVCVSKKERDRLQGRRWVVEIIFFFEYGNTRWCTVSFLWTSSEDESIQIIFDRLSLRRSSTPVAPLGVTALHTTPGAQAPIFGPPSSSATPVPVVPSPSTGLGHVAHCLVGSMI